MEIDKVEITSLIMMTMMAMMIDTNENDQMLIDEVSSPVATLASIYNWAGLNFNSTITRWPTIVTIVIKSSG